MSVVRVRRDVKDRLEKLRKKVGAKSMSELIAILVDIGERELDKFRGDLGALTRSLRFAGEAGRDDSEKIDELLYGGSSEHTS